VDASRKRRESTSDDGEGGGGGEGEGEEEVGDEGMISSPPVPLRSLCPGYRGLPDARPNNEAPRETILAGAGGEGEGWREGSGTGPTMGFFARRLTTISIVYDFNNLGAAPLARLDTFSVVNRATKSVFMGKSRQSSTAYPLSLSLSLSLSISLPLPSFFAFFFLACSVSRVPPAAVPVLGERNEAGTTARRAGRPKRTGGRGEG